MRSEALFINGVYDEVLQDILRVQSLLPEQVCFLQPYSGSAMSKLRDDPPNYQDPMGLLMSITTDLPRVHYIGEIVGWDDKRDLSSPKRDLLHRLIDLLQETEPGLYNASPTGSGESVNLLYVRRLQQLQPPLRVERLTKISDGEPVSAGRTTAGGWAYVKAEDFNGMLS